MLIKQGTTRNFEIKWQSTIPNSMIASFDPRDSRLLEQEKPFKHMTLSIFRCSMMRIINCSNYRLSCRSRLSSMLEGGISTKPQLNQPFLGNCALMQREHYFPIFYYAPFGQQFIIVMQQNFSQKMESFRNSHAFLEFTDEDSENESLFNVKIKRESKSKDFEIFSNKRLIGNKNLWKMAENQAYVEFIKEYYDCFSGEGRSARLCKVYRVMSQFIRSKNYAQCRIHHFKMIKKYHTTQKVIHALEMKFRTAFGTCGKVSFNSGLKVCIQEELESIGRDTGDIWSILNTNYQEINQQNSYC